MRDHLAALRQRGDRSISATDAAAADGHEQVAGAGFECLRDRRRIAPRGLGAGNFGAGLARARRNQRGCHRGAGDGGDIDDKQARTPHLQRPQSRGACDQQVERADQAPGYDDGPSLHDIAAGTAKALPRYRFRQHLSHRAGLIHEVGIDHAVASIGHGVAGFDPGRHYRQWQRRIGRRADEVEGTCEMV